MCVCLAVSFFLKKKKKKKILRSKDTNLLIFHNYGSGFDIYEAKVLDITYTYDIIHLW